MNRIIDRDAARRLVHDPKTAQVLALLNGKSAETRIVGGAVRNVLIGKPAADIDMATTLLPQEVLALAAGAGVKAIPTGLAHGTVTLVVGKEPFEITTLREDAETDGRHAVVRFGRDFAADARRRDFTINALSLDAGGEIHDYCNGLDDLAASRVCFIGDASVRIREDYLRILRFFRFSGSYADSLDDDGLAASIREREGLSILSAERIHAELSKLLITRNAAAMVQTLAETGLLTLLTGSVADLGRFGRTIAWEAARQFPPDATRRLAALAVRIEEDAERLGGRLRLSNAENRRLGAFTRSILRLEALNRPLVVADINRLFVAEAHDDPARSGLTDAVAALDGEQHILMTEEGAQYFERILAGKTAIPVFPVRGEDFLAHGIPPGKRIGALVQAAHTSWLAQGCPQGADTRQSLIEGALRALNKTF